MNDTLIKANSLKLEKKEVVLNPENRKAVYYSIVKCPDNMTRLYSNRWIANNDTVSFESKDGVNFDSKPNLLVEKSGVSHNFFPFIGQDGNMYGLGGVDAWKHDQRWHEIKDVPQFQEFYLKYFHKPLAEVTMAKFEKNGLTWFQSKMHTKKIMTQVNGIYLMKSHNFKDWNFVQSTPVINIWEKGYSNAISKWGKGSEIDGHISVVWFKDRYYIYLRDNVTQGIRFYLYATSTDLINWSDFKSLSFNPWYDYENYYSSMFFKHPKQDIVLGFVPYFANSYCSLRLVRSEDGIKFDVVGENWYERCAYLKKKEKNKLMAVNGITYDGKRETVSMYIHNNYLGLDTGMPVNVTRYISSLKEFDRAFKC